ncbi:MAG TPA: hypothetical protein VMQ83_07435 [Gammaproteobacteria bacterium]|nr:hypothetical protein [Gammaproteobacteria bacterium]
MSAKTTTAPISAPRGRKVATRVPASKDKGHAGRLTHESVAADIAAFRKAGGEIEVLGHTQFRREPAAASGSKAATPAGGTASTGKKEAGG